MMMKEDARGRLNEEVVKVSTPHAVQVMSYRG